MRYIIEEKWSRKSSIARGSNFNLDELITNQKRIHFSLFLGINNIIKLSDSSPAFDLSESVSWLRKDGKFACFWSFL